jgi:hypothetical protein
MAGAQTLHTAALGLGRVRPSSLVECVWWPHGSAHRLGERGGGKGGGETASDERLSRVVKVRIQAGRS